MLHVGVFFWNFSRSDYHTRYLVSITPESPLELLKCKMTRARLRRILITFSHCVFSSLPTFQHLSSVVKFRRHDDWHCAVLMISPRSKLAIKGTLTKNNSPNREYTVLILENQKESRCPRTFLTTQY